MVDFSAVKENTALEIMASDAFNTPSPGSVELEQHAGLENFDLMPSLQDKNAAAVFYNESLPINQMNTSSQNIHIFPNEQQSSFDKHVNFKKTSDSQHNTKIRVPEKNTEYHSEHNLNQEEISFVQSPSLILPPNNCSVSSEGFSRVHAQNEASNLEIIISNTLERPVNRHSEAKSISSQRTHRKDELVDINVQIVQKDNQGSNRDNLSRTDTNHVSPQLESSLHSASLGDTDFNTEASEHSHISLSSIENKLSSGVEISSNNSALSSIESETMETSSSSAPGSEVAQIHQSLSQGTKSDVNSSYISSNNSDNNLNESSEAADIVETDQTLEVGKNNSCDLLPNLSMQAHCDVHSTVLSSHNHYSDKTIAPNVFQESSITAPSGGQSENSVINKDVTVSNSAGTDSNNLCKILTKYVFINKKANHKSNRKGFSFPCRNAFRHFQKAKLRKAKHNKRNIKNSINKVVVNKRQKLIKKKTATENNLTVAKLRKQEHKKASDRSREERRKARELRKEQMSDFENISTDSEKSMKINQKKVNKVANRKLAKGVSKNIHKEENHDMSEEENKTNQLKNRRLLSLDTKLAIIQAMEKGGKTMKVGREFSVSRTNIWRIMKSKNEILAEKSGISDPKKKKKSKLKEKNVKEELGGDEVSRILNEVSKDGEGKKSIESDLVTGSITKERLQRKDLTLEAKIQVVEALENGSKVVRLASQYGVSVSAISRINKNREYFKLISKNGELSVNQKRARESKDPELDRVLLRWYRAIEDLQPGKEHISISNILLKEKAHSLALTMGKDYFASDNWILRWKNRHNIKSKINTIFDREKLKQMDEQVNISQILEELGQQEIKIDEIKREKLLRHGKKPDEFLICEHCGVLISRPNKRKKENGHLVGCPASAIRKDLTLEEKVQVVRALEHPGVKMVALAKKYGVSSSAISRIHKNRVDLLARQASGLANSRRRRERGSKEPEVERVLCEWFKVQHELGIHTSGSMIREKARDIARVMGKDFWPSESWVFRWRHRNNVNDMNSILYGESEEEENLKDKGNDTENGEDNDMPNPVQADISAGGSGEGEEECAEDDSYGNEPKMRKTDEAKDEPVAAKRPRMPRSVMCEKCGYVSSRIKNNRLKSIRHAKGCPDLKPRNELTYENRAKMVKALEEPGATLSSVARQFGVSVSSMSRMNQKKEHILIHGQDHGRQKKRIRDCKEPEVAANLFKWYKEKKDEGVHVTGPKLKDKAKKLAAEMGREFKASSGWLGRWRHRYNIVSSVRTSDKVNISEPISVRRKKSKKNSGVKAETEADHQLTQLQPIPTDIQPDNSIGSCASVIVEPLEPILPPPPQPAPTQIFIHQRFQNPWEMGQHPAAASVWPKEFMNTQAPNLQEDTGVPVTYTYPDSIPKPIFHNMFDSFSGMSYQVAMPVDSTMLNRDYSKPDTTEAKTGSSATHTVPHATHPTHPQHNHHLPAGLSSQVPQMQHHIPTVGHQHNHPHTHQPAVNHNPLPPPPSLLTPSTSSQEDDAEQQRQVMEAFKIMSSFAQKKSLGDQVQAALRTIEMSMKNPQRKPSPRNTYTSI